MSHLVFIYCPPIHLLGLHLQQMELPRLGVKLELQLLAYTTATETQDLSCICNLHHSLRQRWILNPVSEARDWTYILVDTSWVCYYWPTVRTPLFIALFIESRLRKDARKWIIHCISLFICWCHFSQWNIIYFGGEVLETRFLEFREVYNWLNLEILQSGQVKLFDVYATMITKKIENTLYYV